MRPVVVGPLAEKILHENRRQAVTGADAIARIVLVGALPPTVDAFRTAARGEALPCGPRDDEYLYYTIDAIDGLRLPRVETPDVVMMNLLDGQDFLTDTPETDAVVFCYPWVYRPTPFGTLNRMFSALSGTHPRPYDKAEKHLIFTQSAQSFHPRAWREALARSGAKFVTNVTTRRHELPIGFIDKPPYERIQIRQMRPTDKDLLRLDYQMDVLVHAGWGPAQAMVARKRQTGQMHGVERPKKRCF